MAPAGYPAGASRCTSSWASVLSPSTPCFPTPRSQRSVLMRRWTKCFYSAAASPLVMVPRLKQARWGKLISETRSVRVHVWWELLAGVWRTCPHRFIHRHKHWSYRSRTDLLFEGRHLSCNWCWTFPWAAARWCLQWLWLSCSYYFSHTGWQYLTWAPHNSPLCSSAVMLFLMHI